MAAKKKAGMKGKKKIWVDILTPKSFKEQLVGQCPLYEPESLVGRTIKVNLMTLLRDMKKQNMNVTFRVDSITNGKANTKTVGYEVLPTAIKRLVRRGREKIEDSFVVRTKDEINVRLKPLLVTRNSTNRSTKTQIRLYLRNVVAGMVKDLTFDMLVNDIINTKIQRSVKEKLNVIYPLRTCEVRKMQIEGAEANYVKENPQLTKTLKPRKAPAPRHAAPKPAAEQEA